MNKAIATKMIALLFIGMITAGIVIYKFYQSYKTSEIVSKTTECIEKRFNFCSIWSNLDFNPASKPPWDISCGDEPTVVMCKNTVEGR